MFRWLHSIGVFLIFLSALLLLVTSISAPVVGQIAMLKVDFRNPQNARQASILFGSFGHCIHLDTSPGIGFGGNDRTRCSNTHVGYAPGRVMRRIDGGLFQVRGDIDDLTHGFILHPFACALALLAGFASVGGVIGSLIGSILASIAWLLTLAVLIVDFVVFTYVKNNIEQDRSGSTAHFSVGLWTCAAAFIFLFIGSAIVFVTCCTSRRGKKAKGDSTRDVAPSKRGSWGRSKA